MNERRNFYEILFVQPDAPKEIILSSYRTLMQQLNAHPDRGGDHRVAALINKAYATLSDDDKRNNYDLELQQGPAEPESPASNDSYSGHDHRASPEMACLFCKAAFEYKGVVSKDAFCKTCKSPLYPATNTYTDDPGQRKMTRIGKKSSVSFYTHWPQLRAHIGATDNISQDGMMFITSKNVPIGSVVKINCTQFQSVARVVRCQQAGSMFDPTWQIGVEFITLHMRSSRGMFVSDIT